MGWLDPEEQKEVRKKFHMIAQYMCDTCERPISILEMPVVDPKKGYHKWNRKRSPRNCRSFHGKNPRITYHQGECDRTPFGIKKYKKQQKYLKKLKQQGEDMSKKSKSSKKENKKSKKSEKKSKKEKKTIKADPKVKKAVVAKIESKPNHYTKRTLLKRLSEKFEKADIRAALASLWAEKVTRKKDGKYYIVEEED